MTRPSCVTGSASTSEPATVASGSAPGSRNLTQPSTPLNRPSVCEQSARIVARAGELAGGEKSVRQLAHLRPVRVEPDRQPAERQQPGEAGWEPAQQLRRLAHAIKEPREAEQQIDLFIRLQKLVAELVERAAVAADARKVLVAPAQRRRGTRGGQVGFQQMRSRAPPGTRRARARPICNSG